MYLGSDLEKFFVCENIWKSSNTAFNTHLVQLVFIRIRNILALKFTQSGTILLTIEKFQPPMVFEPDAS